MEIRNPSDILELPGLPLTEPSTELLFKKEAPEKQQILGESENKFIVFSIPLISKFELQENVILERNTYLLDTQEKNKGIPQYVLLNFDLCKSTLGDVLSNTEDLDTFKKNLSQENESRSHYKLKSDNGIIKLNMPTTEDKNLEIELNCEETENEFHSSKHISLEKADKEKARVILNLNNNI